MELNQKKKKQSHGSGKSRGSRNVNEIGNDEDDATEPTKREGNGRKILFQIGSIASYNVYDNHLEEYPNIVNRTQHSTSSSLSSPSSSSSSSSPSSLSSENMIELKAKEGPITEKCENKQHTRDFSKDSSELNEIEASPDNNTSRSRVSVATNMSERRPPLSPMQSPPIQVMERVDYDSQRIPSSIFEKNGTLDWSITSNESLFSLHLGDNNNLARDHALRYSDFKPGEFFKSGEFLARSPSLPPIKLEDSKEENSDDEERESRESETSMETESEDKSSIPIVSWRKLSEVNVSDQTPISLQSLPSPKTKKSKKKKKKKKKRKKACPLCCKNTCAYPICHGGLCCFKCRRCLCDFSCCNNTWTWPICHGDRCRRCRCDCSCCKWWKRTSCDCFSCSSCCSSPYLCCCCCYSSSLSSEMTDDDEMRIERKRGEKTMQPKGSHKSFCCFPLCSWPCCFRRSSCCF